MRSALVPAHGVKNEVYTCVMRLVLEKAIYKGRIFGATD